MRTAKGSRKNRNKNIAGTKTTPKTKNIHIRQTAVSTSWDAQYASSSPEYVQKLFGAAFARLFLRHHTIIIGDV